MPQTLKPRQRTNSYWAKRAQEQLELIEQQTLPYLRQVDKIYRNAQSQTLAEIKKLYQTYYSKEGFDTSLLKEIAPKGDVRRFKEDVERAGLSSSLPAGYGYRLSRLELIEAQIWLEIAKCSEQQAVIQGISHTKTIETAYYHNLYVLSKGTGIMPVFGKLDTKTINNILKAKFFGENYSARIYQNRDILAKELKGILAESVATGQNQSKTIKLVRERYGIKRFEASRLLRTETAHFADITTTQVYEDIGIEKWIYVATLDSRTSEDCRELDGQVFDVGKGPTIPHHPNCRCVKASYLGRDYEPDMRIMRDPVTGKNKYTPNITYKEWQAKYL